MRDHGCYRADTCVMDEACPFGPRCAIIENGGVEQVTPMPLASIVDGPASLCWCCRSKGQLRASVLRWTGPFGNSTPLCQSCADSWLDNADDDASLEPRSVRWVDGSRVLAGAA